MIFEFVLEESVQRVGAVVVFSFWSIVCFAVGQHSLHVCDEQSLVDVVVGLESLSHGLEVHGELDVIIVVRNSFPVNWIQEWPRWLMIPHRGQNCLETVVQLIRIYCVNTASRGSENNFLNVQYFKSIWIKLVVLLPIFCSSDNFLVC